MTRIATYAQSSHILANALKAQERVHENQTRAATGQVAQRYQGLAGNARRLLSLEADHRRATQYIENNRLVDQRLQAMETAVSSVLSSATSFKSYAIQALNANPRDDGNLASLSQNLFQQMAALLNTKVDGRYLLSGSRTDIRPVDFTNAGFGPPAFTYPTVANSAYYDGDSITLAVQADETVTLSYGLTADNPAFEKTIRAFHLGATATTSGFLDTVRVNEALRVINEALDTLPNLLSKIGVARTTLEGASGRHNNYLQYFEQSINEIESADVAETLAHLNADTAQLEASYATIARVSRMSLLDYL